MKSPERSIDYSLNNITPEELTFLHPVQPLLRRFQPQWAVLSEIQEETFHAPLSSQLPLVFPKNIFKLVINFNQLLSHLP